MSLGACTSSSEDKPNHTQNVFKLYVKGTLNQPVLAIEILVLKHVMGVEECYAGITQTVPDCCDCRTMCCTVEAVLEGSKGHRAGRAHEV